MGSEQFSPIVTRDVMAHHYAYLSELQQKQKEQPKQPTEQKSWSEDFLRSVGNSAIQTPINAIVQVADKTMGTELLPKVQINALQVNEPALYGTGNYWAQQTGHAIGMLVPFLAVGKGVKTFTRAGMTEAQLATHLSSRSVLGLTMKEAVLTGAVHDSLLRPVDEHNQQPFAVAKGLNGVNGMINMAILHGVGTKFAPTPGAEMSKFTTFIKNPYMGGLVSGVLAGGASAHSHAYLGNLKFDSVDAFKKSAWEDAKLATWRETHESAVTMGVIGLGFGTYHGVKGQFKTGRQNFEWQKNTETAGGASENAGGRDFKVVGGTRALTRAMTEFDATGETMMKVREHLGSGEGIKRFFQKYGPEQSLLVKHNASKGFVVPDAAKLADLIAICKLDPTMAGKGVLGATALNDGSIFMRVGENRINFAPKEQKIREGERAPRRLGTREGYKVEDLAIKPGEEWTKQDLAKLADGEWTPDMVAKLQTLKEYLPGSDAANFGEAVQGTELARMKVVKRLGFGNDAEVIELAPQKGLPDGGALKLVNNYEGGWNADWGKRPYDAKILMNGKVWELESNGRDMTAYVQELVNKDFDDSLWPAFARKLAKDNLQIRDPGGDGGFQYGVSRKTGKLVLTDYEAVDRNTTLEELIGPRDQESIELRERELEKEEAAAETRFDQTNDLEALRKDAEAFPRGSWQEEVYRELRNGSDVETASLSVIAWRAQQGVNPAELWTTASQKDALAKARQVFKDARARGLLH
ncbi:MAG: hypothetical protein IT343_08410 [Candidatus Melainabacteria bacterium]|nr:hypothetical protein [Candidatus Melainabacteria bacterium]